MVIVIGIDTGTKTGLAVMRDGKLTELETFGIVTAMHKVLEYRARFADDLVVCIEDARQRKWVSPHIGRERLKGVGSVNRDAAIWQEWCEYFAVPYLMIAPVQLCGLTKMSANDFAKLTGWQERTSEYARDAGVLAHKYYQLIKSGMVATPDD